MIVGFVMLAQICEQCSCMTLDGVSRLLLVGCPFIIVEDTLRSGHDVEEHDYQIWIGMHCAWIPT